MTSLIRCIITHYGYFSTLSCYLIYTYQRFTNAWGSLSWSLSCTCDMSVWYVTKWHWMSRTHTYKRFTNAWGSLCWSLSCTCDMSVWYVTKMTLKESRTHTYQWSTNAWGLSLGASHAHVTWVSDMSLKWHWMSRTHTYQRFTNAWGSLSWSLSCTCDMCVWYVTKMTLKESRTRTYQWSTNAWGSLWWGLLFSCDICVWYVTQISSRESRTTFPLFNVTWVSLGGFSYSTWHVCRTCHRDILDCWMNHELHISKIHEFTRASYTAWQLKASYGSLPPGKGLSDSLDKSAKEPCI